MEVTGKDYDTCHDMLYNNGYKVYTSIDMEAQELLQTTVDTELEDYNTRITTDPMRCRHQRLPLITRLVWSLLL